MKILVLDIETSPNLAHVWGIWQQNVGLNQLLDVTEVLCWAAKWVGEDEIFFDSVHDNDKIGMLSKIWKLMDEADAIVHYNGQKFDVPHLNREFLELDVQPPSPFKQIDLLKTAKSQFRFPSNKLDYIVGVLGIGNKVKHAGHQLWIDCINGSQVAWDKMEEYNKEDVVLTEKLYERFLPWIKGHPNVALHNGDVDELHCPRCGGDHFIRQGYAYTGISKFQQYQCRECNAWFRGRENLMKGEVGGNIV